MTVHPDGLCGEGRRCFVVLFTQLLPSQIDIVRLCLSIHEEELAKVMQNGFRCILSSDFLLS
jgi:hypothetical protein